VLQVKKLVVNICLCLMQTVVIKVACPVSCTTSGDREDGNWPVSCVFSSCMHSLLRKRWSQAVAYTAGAFAVLWLLIASYREGRCCWNAHREKNAQRRLRCGSRQGIWCWPWWCPFVIPSSFQWRRKLCTGVLVGASTIIDFTALLASKKCVSLLLKCILSACILKFGQICFFWLFFFTLQDEPFLTFRVLPSPLLLFLSRFLPFTSLSARLLPLSFVCI